MQRLIYKSARKATNLLTGITEVSLDVDGEVTKLGTIENFKSKDSTFKALLLDGTTLSSGHKTKKQAGGALKKLHDSGEKAETPVVEAPAEPAPKPEKPAAVIEPVNNDEDDEYIPDPYVGGTAVPEILDDEWGLDETTKELLEIPEFLKRTNPATLAEEM